MFKFRRRLNIHYLVGQGEKIVRSHESHAEKGSPLQVEGFRGERGGEGAEEDGPGQGLDTGTEAGMEAAPVDAEASQAGAQTQAGPQPRHPGPVTGLRVRHDVHIHIQCGDRCQESCSKPEMSSRTYLELETDLSRGRWRCAPVCRPPRGAKGTRRARPRIAASGGRWTWG